MVKQVMLHKVTVALLVLGGKARILIQIHRGNPGKIQLTRLILLNQLGIGPHRS